MFKVRVPAVFGVWPMCIMGVGPRRTGTQDCGLFPTCLFTLHMGPQLKLFLLALHEFDSDT